MRKLFIFDLDGTLINSRFDTFKEGALDFIEFIKGKGFEITIATGRSYESALHFANLLKIDLPFISLDGALIRDRFGKTYMKKAISKTEFKLMKEIFKNLKFVYFYEDYSVIHPDVEKYETIITHWKLKYKIHDGNLLNEPLKAIYMSEDFTYMKTLIRELKLIRSRGFYFYPSRKRKNLFIIDIVGKDVDKSVCVDFFKEQGYDYIVSVGDFVNDFPLLERSDLGILMGCNYDGFVCVNSFDELKRIFT